MSRCTLTLFLFLLTTFSAFAAKKQTFSDAPEAMDSESTLPKIKVVGNHFEDEEGNTIVFRGLAFADLAHLIKQERWDKDYFQAAKDWNANLVRLAVHPKWLREMGMETYMKELDNAVKWAGELGMYVIIDWHTIGNPINGIPHRDIYLTTREETFYFWYQIANRYKENTTVVFYELFNEPTNYKGQMGRLSWKDFKAYMEELIYMIDKIDSTKIPLVAGFNWGYDLSYIKNDPIDHPNVAYVTHPYPQKREAPWTNDWEKDWGFVADKYPVVATEFGFMSAKDRGAHIPCICEDYSYADTLIEYFEKKGISYTPWVFDPLWTPSLIKDWDYTPTRQGAYFKKVLQEKNK